MNRTPPEILCYIALHLNAIDLSNFRLVSRQIGDLLYPVLLYHLSFINVASEARRFQGFLDCHRTQYTRHLTILQGTWPICTKSEWEIHPLQVYEPYPRAVEYSSPEAYEDYVNFVCQERCRNHAVDLQNVLSRLSNLSTITITTANWNTLRNRKYAEITKKVRLSPRFNDSVDEVFQALLLSLRGHFVVNRLKIQGRVDPIMIKIPQKLTHITKIEFSSLGLNNGNIDEFIEMLASFPNLEQAVLAFTLPNLTRDDIDVPIHQVCLPRLNYISLNRLWISEDSLFLILENNRQLRKLHIKDITLTSGSWESFFSRVRCFKGRVGISPEGYMTGLDPRCVYICVRDAGKNLLSRFLADPMFPWPFCKPIPVIE
jgi:hypothetical protein